MKKYSKGIEKRQLTTLKNTEKFLNQVSEYSYTMANKCIDGQDLSDEEMDKIQELYNYANDLSNTLNEMITELNNGIADEILYCL